MFVIHLFIFHVGNLSGSCSLFKVASHLPDKGLVLKQLCASVTVLHILSNKQQTDKVSS